MRRLTLWAKGKVNTVFYIHLGPAVKFNCSCELGNARLGPNPSSRKNTTNTRPANSRVFQESFWTADSWKPT